MKAKERQRQNDADMLSLLNSAPGRRLYVRLLTQSGLWSSSYAESPTATAFNEGRRSIAIALLAEGQRVAPDLYTKALTEQLSAAVADQVEAAKLNEERAADE